MQIDAVRTLGGALADALLPGMVVLALLTVT
jgi:hypothetical protein